MKLLKSSYLIPKSGGSLRGDFSKKREARVDGGASAQAADRNLHRLCYGCSESLETLVKEQGDWFFAIGEGQPLTHRYRRDAHGVGMEEGNTRLSQTSRFNPGEQWAATYHREIALTSRDGQLYPSFEDECSVLLFHNRKPIFKPLFLSYYLSSSLLSLLRMFANAQSLVGAL